MPQDDEDGTKVAGLPRQSGAAAAAIQLDAVQHGRTPRWFRKVDFPEPGSPFDAPI